MKKKYDPHLIEKKWQDRWEESRLYEVIENEHQKKYYVLDMFPYPSGSGLHVGHVTGYTASDVIARYKRQKGYNVLHPMGWDSFGLPAEQYAIHTGTHPQETTRKNVAVYKQQLKSLGLSYDWSREILTSDPYYYKWTQWIFTKLYEMDLAYEAEVVVNFCPFLGTVLSNEEVVNGRSVEGGHFVEKKHLRQWMLRITKYADQLLSDLDLLDWPESLKKLQRNWIGKSVGMEIDFLLKDLPDHCISCFTTRPDTLFGVTCLVVAPEHPLLFLLTHPCHRKEMEAYCAKATQKSDLDRTDLAREKSGLFTGSYAVHPITGKLIPIWVSDYVLITYGTGSIMAVPGHDERDAEFAEAHRLPIIKVINEMGNYIHSTCGDLDLSGKDEEEAKKCISDYLIQRKCGREKVQYRLRDWLFSRQRYWGEPIPILHYANGKKRVLDLNELPLVPPMVHDYKPSKEGLSVLSKVHYWVEVVDPKTNMKAIRETNTMPQWSGSCWYFLRFCDPHNEQEAWSKKKEAYWMPVDLYIGGAEHAVLHLLYSRFWHKVLFDIGYVSHPEPFIKLRNQGLIISKAYKMEGGGYVPKSEVKQDGEMLRHIKTGERVTASIEKMSKSKRNGISPGEIIKEFGADSLRLYALFLGPFDQEKVWQTYAISGCKRFLHRVFALVCSKKACNIYVHEADVLLHVLIHGVEEDLKAFRFNTAIAKMMEFVNSFSRLSQYPRNCIRILIQIIYLFAPHFGEECWEILGEKSNLSCLPFPQFDERFLQKEKVVIVFQVNGKVRGSASFTKGASQQQVEIVAQNDCNVKKFLCGPIQKVVFLPNKLLNIVV